jgi:hypothetical protein
MGHLSNAITIRLGGTQKWFLSWVAASSAQYKKFFHTDLIILKILKNTFNNYGNPDFSRELLRNNKKEESNKKSGQDNMIKNNFVEGSFTYSHTKIARGKTLNITTHFIDALLDAWRIKFSRYYKKRIPILFNPFVKNKRKPRSLLMFKKKKKVKFLRWKRGITRASRRKLRKKFFSSKRRKHHLFSEIENALKNSRKYDIENTEKITDSSAIIDVYLKEKFHKLVLATSKKTGIKRFRRTKKYAKKMKARFFKYKYKHMAYRQLYKTMKKNQDFAITKKNLRRLKIRLLLQFNNTIQFDEKQNNSARGVNLTTVTKLVATSSSRILVKPTNIKLPSGQKPLKTLLLVFIFGLLFKNLIIKSTMQVDPRANIFLYIFNVVKIYKRLIKKLQKRSKSVRNIVAHRNRIGINNLVIRKNITVTPTYKRRSRKIFMLSKRFHKRYNKLLHSSKIYKKELLINKNKNHNNKKTPFNLGQEKKTFKQNLNNRLERQKHILIKKAKRYPLFLYQFLFKYKYAFILPPAKNKFKLLKVFILGFSWILHGTLKMKLSFFSIFRQLLLSLFLIPLFVPQFFMVKLINTLLLRELGYKHYYVYYFPKIMNGRFLLFRTAYSAIAATISTFDAIEGISCNFVGMHTKNTNAYLIANYICHKLGQYFYIKQILSPVMRDLKRQKFLKGFKIIVAGRLTRKERAAFLVRKRGSVTLSKNSAFIEQATQAKNLRFGMVGVKVWLMRKSDTYKPYYYNFFLTSISV